MPEKDFGGPTGRPCFTYRSKTLPKNTKKITLLRMMDIWDYVWNSKYLEVDRRFKSLEAIWEKYIKSLKYLEVLLSSWKCEPGVIIGEFLWDRTI